MEAEVPNREVQITAIRSYLDSHPDAKPQEVIDALKVDGISVPQGMVNNIMCGGRSKVGTVAGSPRFSTRQQPTRVPPAPAPAAAPSPKKSTKSQAIRDYLTEHPAAMPKEIIAGLKQRGIQVTAALASFVRYGRKKESEAVQQSPKIALPSSLNFSSGGLTVGNLLEAKRLVDALGGIERVRAALIILEQLKSAQ